MIKTLKTLYRQFKAEKPGKRFLFLHEKWNERGGGGAGKKVIAAIAGILLIAMGLFLGLVPGVPGFVLALVGFGLIAGVFRSVATAMDRFEVWARKTWSKYRTRVRKA